MFSCSARVLIAGVKFSPSGSGYSCGSTSRRSTRWPLAESLIEAQPTRFSSEAKNRLPTRRTSGISLSAPAMREPITRSAPSSAARHSWG